MNLSAKQNRITDVKNKLMIIGGKGGGYRVGREINWKIRIDTYILLYIKQITNTDLLYSTGTSTICSVMADMGKETK